jgi:transcriptional regulator with GAF, ATPase, and Fis domain
MAVAHHQLKQKLDRDEWLTKVELSSDTAEGQELTGDHALAIAQFLADEGAWADAEARARSARRIFHTAELPEKLWRASFELARITRAQAKIGEAKLFIAEASSAVERLAEHVPEPLRKRYLKTHEQRKLRGLIRALERPDPFEDLENYGISQEMSILVPSARSVVVIGEPLPPELQPWRDRYKEIVGEDRRLLHLFKLVDKISGSDSTVLLTGSSGTGKELFAEAIHRHSSRRDGPLVKVNCAAFVETLLLSELFGHEKGAFTGALSKKQGRFELAHTGTIFLDEIGDVSPNTQVALLRVLQEQTYERVGGSQQLETDVRVIAATNRNLEEMVREGGFRLDLYYRLKGIALELPSLRERRPDLPLLVRHFTQRFSGDDGRRRVFTADALRLLASYNWPGNIRELENFVRSMLLFVETDVIDLDDIRQFDEFFADGEMSDDVPHFEFVQGWWPVAYQASKKRTTQHGTDHAESSPRDESDQKLSPSGPEVPVEAPAMGVTAVPEQATAEHAPLIASDGRMDPHEAMVEMVVTEGLGLQDVKKRLEVECIRRALLETDGNITHAAKLLKMKRPRLSQIINSDSELWQLKEDLGG